MTIELEDMEAANKAFDDFTELRDYSDIPRFKVHGMNQAEMVRHLFISGFCRGVEKAKLNDD